MEVTTNSPRALASQKMVLELLLSDMPERQYTLDNKLSKWAKRIGVGKPRFGKRTQVKADVSHPAIAVNLDACIQCTRCVRACREVQVNDVIGYAGRGEHSKIVFDFDDPMGESTCVACGECVQACPTGALMPARASACGRSTANHSCARSAAWAASSPTTWRRTGSSSSPGATARPTTGGCASRGATASTMRITRTASRGR
jgi:predicted molibdopterin-dependent oxidoreductase YjgC